MITQLNWFASNLWLQVRVYTAKNIFLDLKLAKEDFIRANVYIHKETKIFLPRILYYFAKDMSLPMPGLLETVNECLSEAQRKALKSGMKRGRFEKYINWLPENSTFRYVFHGELARGSTAVWSQKFWLCGLCIEVWKVQMLVLVSLFVFDRTPNVLSGISDKVSPLYL